MKKLFRKWLPIDVGAALLFVTLLVVATVMLIESLASAYRFLLNHL